MIKKKCEYTESKVSCMVSTIELVVALDTHYIDSIEKAIDELQTVGGAAVVGKKGVSDTFYEACEILDNREI